jgi:hypothetical protein
MRRIQNDQATATWVTPLFEAATQMQPSQRIAQNLCSGKRVQACQCLQCADHIVEKQMGQWQCLAALNATVTALPLETPLIC